MASSGALLHLPPLVCAGLCAWQLQRASEKKEMLAARRRALEGGGRADGGGPAGNESVRLAARGTRGAAGGGGAGAAGGAGEEFTPLRLVGRFVSSPPSSPPPSTSSSSSPGPPSPAGSVFVGPRPKSSMGVAQKGYLMITPMKLDGYGRADADCRRRAVSRPRE